MRAFSVLTNQLDQVSGRFSTIAVLGAASVMGFLLMQPAGSSVDPTSVAMSSHAATATPAEYREALSAAAFQTRQVSDYPDVALNDNYPDAQLVVDFLDGQLTDEHPDAQLVDEHPDSGHSVHSDLSVTGNRTV